MGTQGCILLGAQSATMKPVVFPADCICVRLKINLIKAWLGCDKVSLVWLMGMPLTRAQHRARDCPGMCSHEGLWASWLILAGSLRASSFSSSLHKAFPASFPQNLFAVTSLQPVINSWGKTVPPLITWQNVHLYSCITKTISISFAMLRKYICCSRELLTCPGGG